MKELTQGLLRHLPDAVTGGQGGDLPDIERTALHQDIINRYTCHQPIP
ncbi:hypothetical protein [Streptomyces sp. NPDC090080]